MTNSISNINDLLISLNDVDSLLTTNSIVEDDIKFQGGTILYSYNNIIIASEISETYWNELQKNTNIEYIQELPLKQFGGIDYSLIGQLISNTSTNNSDSSNISGVTQNKQTGIYPIITNTILTITANTNSIFSYNITATGTLPITYQVITPENYSGTLNIKNINTLTGVIKNPGTYYITIKAINAFGSYTKELILTTTDLVKITNTNLEVINKLGSLFSYLIESTGSLPKVYSIENEPYGLSISDNIISGRIVSGGTYNMTIKASGLTNSDSKILKINVGQLPIITSSSQIASEVNSLFEYNITSNYTSGVTYSVIGSLNNGLTFKLNKIQGTPTSVGSNIVTIKAISMFGESTQNLTITIYKMNS